MSILDSVRSPADVRALPNPALPSLAEELRHTIIQICSENGGHLASNLGMVDAEIALCRVFDPSTDSLVFDVGHQAYAYKLLTGRADRFASLRQFGGITGFSNRGESDCDAVTAGHSGSALSSAIGIAEGNRLAGNGAYTVAIVGDGSLTNGMVYEALNQLDRKDLRLILLLNDNAMSISKNVGGISRYLTAVRTSSRYFSLKQHFKRFFGKVPLVGASLIAAATAVRDFCKRTVGAETWFESLGIDYIGPVDGNNIDKLTRVLAEAKRKQKPVVVHMMTKKGLGFPPAEEHPERYHSTAGFDPVTGEGKPSSARTYTDVFSSLLCEKAEKDPGITAVTAAMADGCGLAAFRERFTHRFYDVGIAEEHAVTFSAGLSLGNHALTPVLVLYSTFAQRTFDQLWHDFCLQNAERHDLRLVLMLSHCGLVPGDGVTHQGIYDVSLFSSLPDTTVYSPDTFEAFRRAFDCATAKDRNGLIVIRYPKAGENRYPCGFEEHGPWKIAGNAGDVRTVVVTYGRIAENVVAAVGERLGQGYAVVVLEQIRPLPLDEELKAILSSVERVVFAEEGVRHGGIGEELAACGLTRSPVEVIAIDKPYVKCGSLASVTADVGLDTDTLRRRFFV